MYTLFQLAHTTGSTVMRALAWEFPNDPSLANADRQFLLGGSLMVTPVLVQGATSVNGVFPGVADGEIWYDWYTQEAIKVAAGANITIDAPLGHIPVYIRGGSVLPIQEPAMTTRDSRRNPWGLLVALSAEGSATGNLYIDDGESVTPDATLWVDVSQVHQILWYFANPMHYSSSPLTARCMRLLVVSILTLTHSRTSQSWA
jgi:alpha-glucosidase